MWPEYDFTLPADAGIDESLRVLRQYGIVCMHNFVAPDDIEGLREEFRRLFETEANWFRRVDYEHGQAVSIDREKMDGSDFPITSRTFDGMFMKELTDKYLGVPNKVNEDIYVTHDKPDPRPINPLHFDKIHSLKFFLYLLDTTKAGGAFQFVPGSHTIGRQRANEHLRYGGKVARIPNRISEQKFFDEALSIEAPAGSMIIFDADGFHRGGIVEEGHERTVMRGHSHVHPMPVYKPKPFTQQWWCEFPLNPARFAGKVPAKREMA